MGTKKGQRRKTARRAYEPKKKARKKKPRMKLGDLADFMEWEKMSFDFLKMKRKGK